MLLSVNASGLATKYMLQRTLILVLCVCRDAIRQGQPGDVATLAVIDDFTLKKKESATESHGPRKKAVYCRLNESSGRT